MKLNGIHHITAITGDAQRNVDFYVGVMGLRLVKKSVNQDDPTVYHLFYGDEHAKPGLDLTFFEYPGAAPGRAGEGMIHRVVWRVGSPAALDFWSERLSANGIEPTRDGDTLRFKDPEGLEHELLVADVPDEPLIAEHPEVPAEHALQGFHAVRAYSPTPSAAASCSSRGSASSGAATRGRRAATSAAASTSTTSRPPSAASRAPAPVHHVAWNSADEDHVAWQQQAAEHGARPTQVIDRHYFKSIYFREPSGVLFELATPSPGFTIDEPLETLGEKLDPAAARGAPAADRGDREALVNLRTATRTGA